MIVKIPDLNRALLGVLCGVVLLALGLGVCGAENPSVQKIFEDAKEAFHRGDMPMAKAGFQTVLAKDPRHTYARAYMARVEFLEKEKGRTGGASPLQAQMRSVIAPSVEFQGATLESVIEFIPLKTAELTGNSFKPGIIYKGTPEEAKQKKVTLRLSNVPMSEVLRYIGELTQMDVIYEQYAIVIQPKRSRPTTTSPAPPAASSASGKGSAASILGGGSGTKSSDPFAK